MTNDELATLKTKLLAELDISIRSAYQTRNDTELARLLNLPSMFVAYKSKVQTKEVGEKVNYVAVEAMTDANRGRITTFYTMNPTEFSPARADVRSYWDNTFSGALGGQGQATRDALVALWKRAATKAEQYFCTGTGTDLSPGLFTWEGTVTIDDIGRMHNL